MRCVVEDCDRTPLARGILCRGCHRGLRKKIENRVRFVGAGNQISGVGEKGGRVTTDQERS